MSKELKITKEAVLRASNRCSTAKAVLMEMFPEVFVGEWEDITDKCKLADKSDGAENDATSLGVSVPMQGNSSFYCPFLVVPNPEWRGHQPEGYKNCGVLIDLDGYQLKIEQGRIYRNTEKYEFEEE